MNFELLIPISLFIAIAYTIKAVVDARVRHGSLRWGITLVAVALGFGLVEAFGWTEITPGVIAVLVGATGLGNLAFYSLSRKFA